MNKSKTFIQFLTKVLSWLGSCYMTQPGLVRDCSPFLLTLKRIARSRGLTGLIHYVKECRKAYLSYLSGTKIKDSKIGLTRDGLPKALGPLIPGIRRSLLPEMLITSTLLFSTRALKCGRLPDITPIEQPQTTVVPSDIDQYTKDF